MRKISEKTLKRFWNVVSRCTNTELGCWTYGKPHTRKYLMINYQKVALYRIAYEIHFGKIRKGLFGCHSCDNQACINPWHIFPGTHQENMTDAARKKRMSQGKDHSGFQLKGSQVYCSRLTPKQIRYARKVYQARHPQFGVRALARQFGVSHRAMGYAIRGLTWKSVHCLPCHIIE